MGSQLKSTKHYFLHRMVVVLSVAVDGTTTYKWTMITNPDWFAASFASLVTNAYYQQPETQSISCPLLNRISGTRPLEQW